MTRHRRWNNVDWPEWLNCAWQSGAYFCDQVDLERTFIVTLEGLMEVQHGDYIIQGIEGELYPCKPAIFEAMYEEVG